MKYKNLSTRFVIIVTLLLCLSIGKHTLLSATPTTQTSHSIIKIDSINELSSDHPKETIFLFDIDDTLIDFPYMLGSKAWRKYITQVTKEADKNWHDILSLFLAQKHPMITVEPATAHLVKDLQAQGYAVCGLTARERNLWYATLTEGIDLLTIKQLESVDIQFGNGIFETLYPDLAQDSEYYHGVFFANTDTKGEYLIKILKAASIRPKKIVFVDDKLGQVESVASALTELQIDHECYWYCATDDKAAKFNSFIANIQLYYFWISSGQEMLSDDEAEMIGNQYPGQDDDYYLQKVLMPSKF